MNEIATLIGAYSDWCVDGIRHICLIYLSRQMDNQLCVCAVVAYICIWRAAYQLLENVLVYVYSQPAVRNRQSGGAEIAAKVVSPFIGGRSGRT